MMYLPRATRRPSALRAFPLARLTLERLEDRLAPAAGNLILQAFAAASSALPPSATTVGKPLPAQAMGVDHSPGFALGPDSLVGPVPLRPPGSLNIVLPVKTATVRSGPPGVPGILPGKVGDEHLLALAGFYSGSAPPVPDHSISVADPGAQQEAGGRNPGHGKGGFLPSDAAGDRTETPPLPAKWHAGGIELAGVHRITWHPAGEAPVGANPDWGSVTVLTLRLVSHLLTHAGVNHVAASRHGGHEATPSDASPGNGEFEGYAAPSTLADEGYSVTPSVVGQVDTQGQDGPDNQDLPGNATNPFMSSPDSRTLHGADDSGTVPDVGQEQASGGKDGDQAERVDLPGRQELQGYAAGSNLAGEGFSLTSWGAIPVFHGQGTRATAMLERVPAGSNYSRYAKASPAHLGNYPLPIPASKLGRFNGKGSSAVAPWPRTVSADTFRGYPDSILAGFDFPTTPWPLAQGGKVNLLQVDNDPLDGFPAGTLRGAGPAVALWSISQVDAVQESGPSQAESAGGDRDRVFWCYAASSTLLGVSFSITAWGFSQANLHRQGSSEPAETTGPPNGDRYWAHAAGRALRGAVSSITGWGYRQVVALTEGVSSRRT